MTINRTIDQPKLEASKNFSEFEREMTHFGYREIPVSEKSGRIEQVFTSVANKYDLMNDLMSLGMHRIWKFITIQHADVRPGQIVLDLACGTGDLAKALASAVGNNGMVIMSDINQDMLSIGRDRLTDQGLLNHINCIQADAENLPFANNTFDCITMAFGLRNVTRQDQALASMFASIKPGGKVLILEFSHPQGQLLNKLYDLYSFQVIPKLGELITHDAESYEYLVESIRRHPTQEKLSDMMAQAGFEDIEYVDFLNGIVALHKGYKY